MIGVPRVYRHAPWLVLTSVGALVVIAMTVPVAALPLRDPTFENIVKAGLGLAILAVLAALSLLTWRVRTVVDDEGVTQHWITRRFRMPYGEITAVETEQAPGRWFLRVHCGDRTFEVIPCQSPGPLAFSGATGRPPRALVAAQLDIETRWERNAQAPGRHGTE